MISYLSLQMVAALERKRVPYPAIHVCNFKELTISSTYIYLIVLQLCVPCFHACICYAFKFVPCCARAAGFTERRSNADKRPADQRPERSGQMTSAAAHVLMCDSVRIPAQRQNCIVLLADNRRLRTSSVAFLS